MAEPSSLESASRRLSSALDALEAAVNRRLETERRYAALSTQVHALEEDRLKLVETLDGERARAVRLETANRDVSRRLTAAMDTILAVVDDYEN